MFSLVICIDGILYKNYRNRECFLNLRFYFSCHITLFVSNIPSVKLEIPVFSWSIILFITKFLSGYFLQNGSKTLTFWYQFPFIFFPSFLLIKYHFPPQQRIKMSFILLHFLLHIGQENLFYIKVILLQFSLSQQPEILAVVWITGTILRTFIFLTLPEMTGVSNKQDISG